MYKQLFFLLVLNTCLSCGREPLSLPVFRELPSPFAADLSAVWFTDSLNGVVTGGFPWSQGWIASTADGGRHWQTDTVLAKKTECVMFDATGQGYVCGLDGLALHRPPGSRHWYVFRVDWCWHRSCYFPNPQYGVIVSGEGYRSGQVRNLGPDLFWRLDTAQLFPNELDAVWFSDSLTVHAAGYGWMLRSADAGRHWERLDVPDDFYRSLHFPTAEVGYACGYGGVLLKTLDAGRHWDVMHGGGLSGKKNALYRALWFDDALNGWLVGENGLFRHTDDGGAHWKAVAGAPSDAHFTDVFTRNGRGWATAEGGRIFYFEY